VKISNSTAIVTGGALGLGAATAEMLHAAGARGFALDLAESIAEASPTLSITYLKADVTKSDQVDQVIDQIAADGPPLRFVVNCAGIAPVEPVLSSMGRHDLELFRHVVETNLIGTFNVLVIAAAAIAQTLPLPDGSRGVIINTASIGAIDGMPGTAAYAASKGGVAALGMPSARDLAAFGIRVMTIAPGTFRTRMNRGENTQAYLAGKVPFPQRLGMPDEFAKLVRSIIENDYLNGDMIRIDGAVRHAP